MSYAELGDVKARMGPLSRSLDAPGANPGPGDVERFLSSISDEVDAELGARGVSTPLEDGSAAAKSLLGLVADGALVLTLQGLFPNEEGPAAAAALLKGAQARYAAAWKLLRDGKHPAVRLMEDSSGAVSATSFWLEEPTYGMDGYVDSNTNPYHAPEFERGQVL